MNKKKKKKTGKKKKMDIIYEDIGLDNLLYETDGFKNKLLSGSVVCNDKDVEIMKSDKSKQRDYNADVAMMQELDQDVDVTVDVDTDCKVDVDSECKVDDTSSKEEAD